MYDCDLCDETFGSRVSLHSTYCRGWPKTAGSAYNKQQGQPAQYVLPERPKTAVPAYNNSRVSLHSSTAGSAYTVRTARASTPDTPHRHARHRRTQTYTVVRTAAGGPKLVSAWLSCLGAGVEYKIPKVWMMVENKR